MIVKGWTWELRWPNRVHLLAATYPIASTAQVRHHRSSYTTFMYEIRAWKIASSIFLVFRDWSGMYVGCSGESFDFRRRVNTVGRIHME
jgi:hypothetical protein